ncbi:MAG: hypothetical protein KIT73_10370 [Burkholderiales bacterium]|nr:hypothetical protein [Burkholderiales bacterium]
MKQYLADSPEAVARVLAMTMITDARLDDRELEAMDRLDLYRLLGLDKAAFSVVVRDYCDDLVAAGSADGRVDLLDRERIDAVADAVVDPRKRIGTAQMVLAIMKADGLLHDAELTLFRYVLTRWGLSLEDIRRAAA